MDLEALKSTWQEQPAAETQFSIGNVNRLRTRIRQQMGPLDRMLSPKQALAGIATATLFGGGYLLTMADQGLFGWNAMVMALIMVIVIAKNAYDYWFLRQLERGPQKNTLEYLSMAIRKIQYFRYHVRWIGLIPVAILLALAVGLLTPGEPVTPIGLIAILGFAAFALGISLVISKYFYRAELERYEALKQEFEGFLREWREE